MPLLCYLRNSAGPADIRDLTPEEAMDIYAELWTELKGDDLQAGVDSFAFDTAICCQPVNAIRWLVMLAQEQELNNLPPQAVIEGLELFRRRRAKSDLRWATLGPEWTNRCNRAKRRALRLVEREPVFGETVRKVLNAEA